MKKIICDCPYLHFVSINAFTKFYQNPSIGPQDMSINEISASIKSHNSVEKKAKNIVQSSNLVNINANTKFDVNPQINSQDIEHKQNSDANQGP